MDCDVLVIPETMCTQKIGGFENRESRSQLGWSTRSIVYRCMHKMSQAYTFFLGNHDRREP